MYLREESESSRLSADELEYVYDFVKDEILRSSELYAKVASDVDFRRGKNSLRLAAVRMHMLVHGILPLDMQPNVEWYQVPQTMIQFAQNKGINVHEQIQHAREEGETRKKLPLAEAKVIIEETINSFVPSIRDYVERLKASGQFAWLKTSDLLKALARSVTYMARKLQDGLEAAQIVKSQLLSAVKSLVKQQEQLRKERELAQLAKKRQKEIEQRRRGTIWKGVMT